MAFSTVEALQGLAERRSAKSREREAWKVAQIAVHIMTEDGVMSDGAVSSYVMTARKLLAESRRQAGAAAGGEANRG